MLQSLENGRWARPCAAMTLSEIASWQSLVIESSMRSSGQIRRRERPNRPGASLFPTAIQLLVFLHARRHHAPASPGAASLSQACSLHSPLSRRIADVTPLQQELIGEGARHVHDAMRKILLRHDLAPPAPNATTANECRAVLNRTLTAIGELGLDSISRDDTLSDEAESELRRIVAQLLEPLDNMRPPWPDSVSSAAGRVDAARASEGFHDGGVRPCQRRQVVAAQSSARFQRRSPARLFKRCTTSCAVNPRLLAVPTQAGSGRSRWAARPRSCGS